jgi:stage II sporulation protein D
MVRLPRVQVVLVFAAVLLASCTPGPARVRLPGSPAAGGEPPVRVQAVEGGQAVVRDVALEEYVAGTVVAEVHPAAAETAAPRLFEVQAVLARTYAVANRRRHAAEGFDLCSTTHCQLYDPGRLRTSRWSEAVALAVRRTAGRVLWFAGAPARPVFHADCGGHTSDAAAVWGSAAPAYLTGEPDGGPARDAHAAWTFETTTPALRAALNADARTAVGARLDRVEIAGRDAAGRAEQIVLRGTRAFVVRGEVFRAAVTRALGVKSVRSTLFSVKKTGDRFVFSGKGFGHGVGLCQAGAMARLRAGASPEEVLRFYFPGTSLRK